MKGKTLLFYSGWVFVAVLIAITVIQRPMRWDLEIVWRGTKALSEGKVVYDFAVPWGYNKPPLVTLLFLPLVHFPLAWVERAWDFAVVAVFLFWAYWLANYFPAREKLSARALCLLGVLFVFNPLNLELRLGQYNLLAAAAIFFSVLYEQAFLIGVVMAITVLLKQTNLFFVPWMLLFSTNRRKTWRGFVSTILGLSALYLSLFGWNAFVTDHLLYQKFVNFSLVDCITKWENHGIPGLLITHGWSMVWVKICAAVGLLLSILASWAIRDRVRSFAWIALITIVLSPTAWYQNYCLALLFTMVAWNDFLLAPNPFKKTMLGACLAVLYVGLEVLNPTVMKHLPFIPSRYPFYFLCVSLALYSLAFFPRVDLAPLKAKPEIS